MDNILNFWKKPKGPPEEEAPLGEEDIKAIQEKFAKQKFSQYPKNIHTHCVEGKDDDQSSWQIVEKDTCSKITCPQCSSQCSANVRATSSNNASIGEKELEDGFVHIDETSTQSQMVPRSPPASAIPNPPAENFLGH